MAREIFRHSIEIVEMYIYYVFKFIYIFAYMYVYMYIYERERLSRAGWIDG